MSVYESGSTNGTIAATSSTPNTWMGGAYNLVAGTTAISGFDIYPVNLSGGNFNALKITIDVWGSVNTSGTVNATTPAFGNLLASYSLTSSGTFSTGFYYPFEGTPNGVNPGISLATPLSIPSTQIGLSFNYMGSTDGGVTFFSTNSLTSLISGGASPVTTGSEVFNGYYRNANSENNGNFTSSLRALGGIANQSLAVRVYTVVPEPSTVAFVALGATALFIFRRRT
ncbi:MAG: hypothetical protein C5B50_15710 [Verrucomicrobia bacterium]|nr:MAG: hypothetical protein C5B50_15710 [Verrucomicrobiota bacterium]